MFPKIKQNYIDKGLVRYRFVNVPLRSIHPLAQKAAEAAMCAGEQDNFWEMHDKLFQEQPKWVRASFPLDMFSDFASEIGLDVGRFKACLKGGDTAWQINADLKEAVQRGVRATPTFFINGRKLEGAYPFEVFQQVIEAELKK